MPDKNKHILLLLAVLAGVISVVSITTKPRQNTRFTSAPRPAYRQSTANTHQEAAGKPSATAAKIPVGSTTETQQSGTGDTSGSGKPGVPQAAAAKDAVPLWAKRSLFSPVVPSGSAGVQSLPGGLMPLPPIADGQMPLPAFGLAPESRQRQGWDYVGTVRINGVAYALIEDKKSKAGVYLKTGDVYRGVYVKAIRQEYVVVAMAGREARLLKNNGLSEETASGMSGTQTAQPAPAAGAAPGQPAVAGFSPAGAVTGAFPGQPGGGWGGLRPQGGFGMGGRRGNRGPFGGGGVGAPSDGGDLPQIMYP